MSKSLKNFTTVREALAKGTWTPRGLRIAFLLGAWKDGLEITDDVVKAGSSWEERVNNFFIKARDLERNPTKSDTQSGALGSDGPVKEALQSAKFRLHDALCDSFDTPAAMRVISDLITAYNSEKSVSDGLTFEIAAWINDIVNIFGLDSVPDAKRTGWSGIDVPSSAEPFVYSLAAIRDHVRKQAIEGVIDPSTILAMISSSNLTAPLDTPASKPYAEAAVSWLSKLGDLLAANAEPKQFLPLCDQLRDTTLWDLGIYLEDRENQPALVRPLNASLRLERSNREALTQLKLDKAKAAKEAKDKEELERQEKAKLSHLEMFRISEFSAWDEQGLPTKDAEGKEVAKSRGKKLKKEWERQKKLHETWLAGQKEQ